MSIKNNSGFTIIEIIAVLIVMSIITAFAVGRVADNKPELIAQKEVLKVHLRYAQSRAMNSNDNYGIESNGNTYWLFRISSANRVNFPGEAYSGTQQTVDRTLTLSSGSDNESIIITRNTGFIQ